MNDLLVDDLNDGEPVKQPKGRPAKIPSYNVQVPIKLRVIDTSACIPLRLDHKTVIFVKAGVDLEAVRAKFENRDFDNKSKISRGKAAEHLKKKGPKIEDIIETEEGLDDDE